MGRKVVIVGGVAGGMSAATRLRRLDEQAEIVVFERGPYASFANCGLPYYLGHEISQKDKLIVQSPERLRQVFGLNVRVQTEVVSIDRENRQVTVRDLSSGQTSTESYDQLILSPGARAVMPNWPGADRPGHFFLRTIPQMDGISDWVDSRGAKTAVVIGGGYIGLEAVEQLHLRGLSVTLIQNGAQVLSPLDPEMAAFVHLEMRKHGVQVLLGESVAGFRESTGQQPAAASLVELESGTSIPADLVVIAVGVRPEVGLAESAGLELGSTGGIKVSLDLRTSDSNIWAVGDAIEVTHGVTGKPALIALAGPANRQGRIAADNICGIPSIYKDSIGTALVRVFDLTAGCTGANEGQLRAANMPFERVHLHPNSHAGYFPGAKPIALKLLFSTENGRLLGAQAVGEDGVDKRIDILATAIKAKMTIDDIAELELGYAPPFGSAKDPVNLAGMVAQNVLAGRVKVAHWDEVDGLVNAGHGILDVRDPAERERGQIPGSVNIPLAQLRSRLDELPRETEWLVHCASGQRSYNACRVLMQHGYRCRNLTGSFKTWTAAKQGLSSGPAKSH